MPRDFLGKKVLILGSGGLKIGQAGEFDYSGSQAIKALKQENIKTVLVNPNIATVQTDVGMADQIYYHPLQLPFVTKIIEQERPDGILLGFGGQTALNLGLDLEKEQILSAHNIAILGTHTQNIQIAEDREAFKVLLDESGITTPKSFLVRSVEEACHRAETIGFPVMMRAGFSLGGLGSGKISSLHELRMRAEQVFAYTDNLLIEEYLYGWKEIEFEVVRDRSGQALTICAMENFDPMGIHTGESIVIAPTQTLDNQDYQLLRNVSLKVADLLQVQGECNVQFAFNPNSGEYRVIEMNPRLSRSSALASKATGYPLAYIAAKLALGYLLHEIPNAVTQKTTAFFEPSLDYVAVKMPRWDTSKLPRAERKLGSEMKSVGEVMGLGRSFHEAFQKAIRMLNIGSYGIEDNPEKFIDLKEALQNPTDQRVFAVYEAMRAEISLEKIHQLTQIDPWFLHQIYEIFSVEQELRKEDITPVLLQKAKRYGFSDQSIAKILKKSVQEIRQLRISHKILPSIKQIDTLSGEFEAQTSYLYLTYWGDSHDVAALKSDSVAILGSGPYCIGSSVEFDWCAVNAAKTLKKLNHKAIIINSNPETVSTDYDESERLYFEELTEERVLDILDFETPKGVIVALGGQIPNNLSTAIDKAGFPLLGTSAANIHLAENRKLFSTLLRDLDIKQPEWISAENIEQVREFISKTGFPVIIRPSFVLSGAAMRVVFNELELLDMLMKAEKLSKEFPVVISKFIDDAKELEIDGVAQQGRCVIEAISEHIEPAGVHSGDATILLPPQKLYVETVRKAKMISKKIVKALKITGPYNIQLMAKDNDLFVIECNMRASRSFPFVSKTIGHNLIEIATRIYLGCYQRERYETLNLPCYGVKSPQFSYQRLKGANPVSTVEMSSTGEVACLHEDFLTAFYLSWLSANQKITGKKILLSIESKKYKSKFIPVLKELERLKWKFYAVGKTHDFLVSNGIGSIYLSESSTDTSISVQSLAKAKDFDLMISLPKDAFEIHDEGFELRRMMIDFNIPLVTNPNLALILLNSFVRVDLVGIDLKPYQEIYQDMDIYQTTVSEEVYDSSLLSS